MANVTDVRKSIRALLDEVVRTREPAVILQRSKPVAYLVDAETFEEMQRRSRADNLELTASRTDILDRILRLKARIAERSGVQQDSTRLVRELREGSTRYE
jgi:prevent-host-death family protein